MLTHLTTHQSLHLEVVADSRQDVYIFLTRSNPSPTEDMSMCLTDSLMEAHSFFIVISMRSWWIQYFKNQFVFHAKTKHMTDTLITQPMNTEVHACAKVYQGN